MNALKRNPLSETSSVKTVIHTLVTREAVRPSSSLSLFSKTDRSILSAGLSAAPSYSGSLHDASFQGRGTTATATITTTDPIVYFPSCRSPFPTMIRIAHGDNLPITYSIIQAGPEVSGQELANLVAEGIALAAVDAFAGLAPDGTDLILGGAAVLGLEDQAVVRTGIKLS